MTLKLRKCPACVFVDEHAPAMLPEQFCEQHAGMSLPLGPDGRIVVPERRGDGFNGQRWHEIATEGLPPEGERVLCCDVADVQRGHHLGWEVINGAWRDGDWNAIYDDEQPTHWHPLPAPPTRGR